MWITQRVGRTTAITGPLWATGLLWFFIGGFALALLAYVWPLAVAGFVGYVIYDTRKHYRHRRYHRPDYDDERCSLCRDIRAEELARYRAEQHERDELVEYRRLRALRQSA